LEESVSQGEELPNQVINETNEDKDNVIVSKTNIPINAKKNLNKEFGIKIGKWPPWKKQEWLSGITVMVTGL